MRKLLKVYESVLQQLEESAGAHDLPPGHSNVWAKEALPRLVKRLAVDGFHYEHGHIRHKGQIVSLPTVREAAAALDMPELHRLR